MAQATVKTVQYVDPRIEPQPDPVYDYIIGPTQNQYYKIGASALSDSYIAFNNLTTLGVDRAYLDTFEIELEVEMRFKQAKGEDPKSVKNGGGVKFPDDEPEEYDFSKHTLQPLPPEWTFQSWPFNSVCEEARVNINGGAFFSQPLSYIRAKERYMNQAELAKCYENLCPWQKPICQYETGRTYNSPISSYGSWMYNAACAQSVATYGCPTRYGAGMYGFNQSAEGIKGGFNNAIVRTGAIKKDNDGNIIGWDNYYIVPSEDWETTPDETVITVRWREPLFVSPFSSRYDATYGRPLYNITSIDLAFNLVSIENMIRVAKIYKMDGMDYRQRIDSYNIHIKSAQLCYQVMTIPPGITKPLTTLVPYRRFVPYITEYHSNMSERVVQPVDVKGQEVEILSGTYTFNEIPTAIWAFIAPVKARYQTNEPDTYSTNEAQWPENMAAANNWDSNKLFGFIRSVDLSLANTTQILATAQPQDLYRIAKANGCEDSYLSWAVDDAVWPVLAFDKHPDGTALKEADPLSESMPKKMYYGAGSVLRMKPGVDLIIPDQALIPGANANNMVFQAKVKAYIPPNSSAQQKYALWLLFEYVGVAAISPGQCEITMNPLGSGEIMDVSPVLSATSEATEGQLEGSGFWDVVKRGTRIAGQLADDGIISRILKRIPGASKAAAWAEKHGLGEPACKRGRGGAVMGGAVIGKGLNDWV